MSAHSSFLSLTVTWGCTFSVFLCNTQLGKNYIQRDAVDHAAAVAADVAGKTFCDKQGPPAEVAVREAITPILSTVGDVGACRIDVKQSAISVSGGRTLDACVRCRFPCTMPAASELLCDDGVIHLEKCQQTMAMGCDAK